MSAPKAAGVAVVVAVAAMILVPVLIFGNGTASAGCIPLPPVATPSGNASVEPSGLSPAPSGGPSGGGQRATVVPSGAPGNWNTTQLRHAATIVVQGQRQKVPPRGWVIAVATAMQETHLLNYANENVPISLQYPHDAVGSDHDSVGLFQQRPNPPHGQGSWGTVEELMTPHIAASKFFSALLRVEGWERMPLTKAAQAVQRSAFPNAYAKWEDSAQRVVAFVLGGLPNLAELGGMDPLECVGAGDVQISAQGWVKPINAKVGSGFRIPDRPRHAGVDLIAPRGTPIRAAAAGKVVWAGCDPGTGNCNVDGSPSTPGCGWYVDIWHPGDIVTRYCHMLKRPAVQVGQTVQAGQVIGVEGSSGNSSGPHLHFEVHLGVAEGGSANRSNAVDPVEFMRRVGAPLGEE